jgi:hypothetical protein
LNHERIKYSKATFEQPCFKLGVNSLFNQRLLALISLKLKTYCKRGSPLAFFKGQGIGAEQ